MKSIQIQYIIKTQGCCFIYKKKFYYLNLKNKCLWYTLHDMEVKEKNP